MHNKLGTSTLRGQRAREVEQAQQVQQVKTRQSKQRAVGRYADKYAQK